MLLVDGVRLFLQEPEWGNASTLTLGLIAISACGSTNTGIFFPVFTVAYIIFSAVALQLHSKEEPQELWHSKKHHSAAAILVTLAIIVSGTFAMAIPALYAQTERWIQTIASSFYTAGFHDGNITLDSLDQLLNSNEMVLRVYGDSPEHLRGAAYSHYIRGHWRAGTHKSTNEYDLGQPLTDDFVELRAVKDDIEHIFIPLGVSRLHAMPDQTFASAAGTLRTPKDTPLQWARFRLGKRFLFPVARPTRDDRSLPENIREPLRNFTDRWTEPEMTREQRIHAIRSQLEIQYTYALQHEKTPGVDPVIDFLQTHRSGHCEYFASAMTLLARSAGVPARFVTGYRVIEHNKLGDYFIVRERHAHAWTEVFLPETGWTTIDPSPIMTFAPSARTETPWLPGTWDYLRSRGKELAPWIALVFLVGFLVAMQFYRLRTTKEQTATTGNVDFDETPEFIQSLFTRLESFSLTRKESETLETFARTLCDTTQPTPDLSLSDKESAANILIHYAALRYGTTGSLTTLQTEIEGWLAGSQEHT